MVSPVVPNSLSPPLRTSRGCVDSMLVAADVAPMLLLILLIKDRTVRIAYVGRGRAWRFWADDHQLTVNTAVADGR